MVFVTSECDSGQYTATGFLVGPQTMITALHVVEDEDGTPCEVSTEQEETGRTVSGRAYTAWMTDGPADSRITDLAVVHLSAQLKGYYFKLATASPRVGERVLALGYSLGNALSLNQGSVLTAFEFGGVPLLRFNLLGAKGSSGGPILNLNGLVVGLTQRGSTSASASSIESLDLARFVDGRPSSLCDETARKGRNTLCGTVSSSTTVGKGSGKPSTPAAKPPPGAKPPATTPTTPTPPPPTTEPVALADVWFSAESSCDPAKKLFHVAAQSTRVYVITQFNRLATSADTTTLSFSLRKPDGNVYATRDFQVSPTGNGWSCFSVSVELAGGSGRVPMGGQWVAEVSLPDGVRKSFALDVERYNNPFELTLTPSGAFTPSYGSVTVTWRLVQDVPSRDTYVLELVTPSGKVTDYGTIFLSLYGSGYEYLSTYCYSGYYSDTCEYGNWTVRMRRNAETIWSTAIVATH